MITRSLPDLPDRFAVLADIHGNADALRAVLADMRACTPDAVLLLGDHFSGPLDAAGTAAQLLSLPALALRGNHDRYLLEQPLDDLYPSDRIARLALDDSAMAWLAGMPEVLSCGDVWACHAMPGDDNTYWTHMVSEAGDVLPRPMDQIAGAAAGIDARLILCAHTHLPALLQLPTGQILLNPGSVGCPAYSDVAPVPHVVQTRTPAATWALVERDGAGFRIAHRHVFYDTARMVAAARGNGRDEWAAGVGTGMIR